jgi:hypothetical protein
MILHTNRADLLMNSEMDGYWMMQRERERERELQLPCGAGPI